MEDRIIEAIKSNQINFQNISFEKIREIGHNENKDAGVLKERGRDIIQTQEQLNQYLYQYAPMIKKQWKKILAKIALKEKEENLEIIDYGCGQGLATALFFDDFKGFKDKTSQVTLIDPSKISLERAKSIIECYKKGLKVISVNKDLDNVNKEDIKTEKSSTKFHLFSNILDIEKFDISQLVKKITNFKGKNYFFAVSHNRDFEGGKERLLEFYDLFEKYNCTSRKKLKFEIIRTSGQSQSIFTYVELNL